MLCPYLRREVTQEVLPSFGDRWPGGPRPRGARGGKGHVSEGPENARAGQCPFLDDFVFSNISGLDRRLISEAGGDPRRSTGAPGSTSLEPRVNSSPLSSGCCEQGPEHDEFPVALGACNILPGVTPMQTEIQKAVQRSITSWIALHDRIPHSPSSNNLTHSFAREVSNSQFSC